MTTRAVPVVIVGAGPTGVTAATLLAARGVEVLVLDRWSGVYPQPRAVHLDDEVYRILAQLGVAEQFARISRPSQGLRLQDHNHHVFAEFGRGERTGRHGYPQANMFDQPELETLLRANLRRHPSASVRGDVEVTAVHQDDGGAVRVDLTDRDTGAHETIHASYVLGCDGANSVVRAAIGARMRDLHFQQRWLVVDVNTDHDLAQWDGVHQVCDPDRAATYMRIGERRYRWEFRLKSGERGNDFAQLTALRPLIEPWTRGVGDNALEIVRAAEYTFRAQLADKWRDRRVFLLGDAAHLTPPFIGQGMGTGLRDANNLVWKLAAVLDGTLPESILDSYEAERRPHARAIIRLAIGVGTAMTAGGRAGDWLRGLIAPRLHLVPGLRERVVDSATPRLRRSSLVERGRRPGGLAGTLCPNLPVDDSRRFDDLAGARFALVTAQPFPGPLNSAAEPHSAVVIEVEPGRPLHTWLTSHGATAALVRPDRTVLIADRGLQPVLRTAARLGLPAGHAC